MGEGRRAREHAVHLNLDITSMITISPRAKENRKENPIAESQCGQAGSGTITPAKLADKQQPIETESTGEDSTSSIN